VESLAAEIGSSTANTSQHLQALRRASLVDSRKDGLFVFYRWIALFEIISAIARIPNRCRWMNCSGELGKATW
jgi:hypothetical protein